MSAIRLIAQDELRLMRRNQVAMLGLLMLIALSVIAALSSIAHRDNSDQMRARFQASADLEFDGQPARHPHRMVHYGHFVFRPLPALAAFDPGVDGYTGNTIYLEGHRQNSANFGDVRQSSLLMRFGQLTPAFVLQALAPLVLIFIGFGIVARERERGTIRQLQTHGASARQILGGKALALSAC
jgi:ABC-2 type transport system permease protein